MSKGMDKGVFSLGFIFGIDNNISMNSGSSQMAYY